MTDFARDIRDATIARLETLARYHPAGRPDLPPVIRRTPVMPPQVDDLPCLLCFCLGQTMSAEGDANAGAPSFEHELKLAIASVLPADDSDALDDLTSAAGAEILELLLEDPDWLALFEAVTRVEQEVAFDQQNYLAAIVRTTITVTYRSDWPPRVPDTLALVSLRRVEPDGAPVTGVDIALP